MASKMILDLMLTYTSRVHEQQTEIDVVFNTTDLVCAPTQKYIKIN